MADRTLKTTRAIFSGPFEKEATLSEGEAAFWDGAPSDMGQSSDEGASSAEDDSSGSWGSPMAAPRHDLCDEAGTLQDEPGSPGAGRPHPHPLSLLSN